MRAIHKAALVKLMEVEYDPKKFENIMRSVYIIEYYR